uniref:L-carnitine dehydratase/bile acid-inducible protein F n=1 Tax=Mycolicibacterium brisbanense TaxID=146020 RepID=B8R4J2_9MYCO|nr:hypothetical protein [Mycolicibacterium brisbanense]
MTPKTAVLEGIRVLDLTTFLSGPFATQTLADLGADVIKVEPPTGDSSRAIPPHYVDGESAYFLSVNRNKRSLVADLKDPSDRDLIRDLALCADVLVENYRPGVIDRLGLSYDEIRRDNPGLVWASISGFGQTGPYRDRPAYDMIVQALSGGMSLTGEPDGPPVRSGLAIGDIVAGLYSDIGILGALVQRAATGAGRRIDVSMLDCQISLLSYQAAYHLLADVDPGRQGRAHDSIPTYRAFTAGDGVDVMVTANTEGMWRALCDVLGVPDLVDDTRFCDGDRRQAHRDELSPLLETAFRAQHSDQVIAALIERRVPAARVHTVREALQDPQVRHREMVVDIPALDSRRPLQLVGSPVKVAGTVPEYRRPPQLDEHREEIVQDWLHRAAKINADSVSKG